MGRKTTCEHPPPRREVVFEKERGQPSCSGKSFDRRGLDDISTLELQQKSGQPVKVFMRLI
ncbi:MAG: hypothetical protein LAT80_04520, partial [Balneolaceae bacterium]|nr:hypothetical protein [Balneolaceae bacterium]